MTKETLLQELYGTGLIVNDLRLFLDTHPEDHAAMMDYRKFCTEYAKLSKTYERDFGPLTSMDTEEGFSEFSWTRGPWPWKKA